MLAPERNYPLLAFRVVVLEMPQDRRELNGVP